MASSRISSTFRRLPLFLPHILPHASSLICLSITCVFLHELLHCLLGVSICVFVEASDLLLVGEKRQIHATKAHCATCCHCGDCHQSFSVYSRHDIRIVESSESIINVSSWLWNVPRRVHQLRAYPPPQIIAQHLSISNNSHIAVER